MPISDEELLQKIKIALNISGDYQDGPLSIYISEAKEFMLDGGVKEEIVNSTSAIGVIARGVADLWNYGAGNAQLSLYFKQRAAQLALK